MAQPKLPVVELSYELYCEVIQEVVSFWTETKLFSTKADRQSMLIVESQSAFKTIINTEYMGLHTSHSAPSKLEDIFGTQFAKDTTSAVMSQLLTGVKTHTVVV